MGFFYITHVVICVVLVCIILFQDGKTGGLVSVADTGNSMFGARGASSFLTKLTSSIAIVFMVSSLFLAYRASPSTKSIVGDDYQPPAPSNTAPQTPGIAPNADIIRVDEQGNTIGSGSISDALQGIDVITDPSQLPDDMREELQNGNKATDQKPAKKDETKPEGEGNSDKKEGEGQGQNN